MKPYLSLILIMLVAVSFGCTQYEKVVATEGNSLIAREYESLGVIEVKRRASRISSIKERLKDQLADLADERYGADAVINVEYWPNPDTNNKFPNGEIYARGEMIRYKRF